MDESLSEKAETMLEEDWAFKSNRRSTADEWGRDNSLPDVLFCDQVLRISLSRHC
jgi:hypothetical protein